MLLRSGELNLELAPAVGGSIARFYSQRDGSLQHWLRPASGQAVAAGAVEAVASFPLVPFCNRIRNGRFHFQGQEIVLPPNRGASPHTIHGYGWQCPWAVMAQDAHSARLQLDYAGGPWPYHFRAVQTYALEPAALHVSMEIENRDRRPMPCGLGHHPYLPHRPGTRLTVSAQSMWRSDAELLPIGLDQPPLLEQLRAGVLLADVEQDNNFIGWDHIARVDWPAAHEYAQARALRLQAEPPLDFFVLYSPAGADHFCIEPVSNCTDWLNLDAYPQTQVGGTVLAPGECLKAAFTLRPEWSPG